MSVRAPAPIAEDARRQLGDELPVMRLGPPLEGDVAEERIQLRRLRTWQRHRTGLDIDGGAVLVPMAGGEARLPGHQDILDALWHLVAGARHLEVGDVAADDLFARAAEHSAVRRIGVE